MLRTIFVIMVCLCVAALHAQIPAGYKGTPFHDSVYTQGAQCIPGRVELAYYDFGGEGVAYHDTSAINEGAALNHTSAHWRPGVSKRIAFFRENEGVDISYTKDWADFNHPNKVDPAVNQLYIGWQADNEWTNYTVDIKAPGRYKIITVYGNHDNGTTLWLNNQFATKLVLPEATGNWHNWTQATVGEIVFPVTGLNLLTLKYNRGSNLAYLDFVWIGEISGKK
jgi:hypothetical protein